MIRSVIFFIGIIDQARIGIDTKERCSKYYFVFGRRLGLAGYLCSILDSANGLNRKFQTPNMVKLANQDMRFTTAYASSVCSSTRISFFIGSNEAMHKVINWTLQKNQNVDEEHPTLDFPKWNVNGISPVQHISNDPMLLQQFY